MVSIEWITHWRCLPLDGDHLENLMTERAFYYCLLDLIGGGLDFFPIVIPMF